VSEYQYYGFQAIDRPLSEDDMRWLRGLSTRAQITTTSFVNVYNWGDFRGDPIKLMERCFDVFVYAANWGSRRFMLRLPRASFDAARAELHCARDCVSLRQKKDCVLLEFSRDDEPGEWEGWDDGSGWLASLTPLRGDVLDGDWRCLYLAWLCGIEIETLPESATEPPVPPGMKDLSAPLRALVDFLGIDTELIEVAAERSAAHTTTEPPAGALDKWIRSLPVAEKDELLLRIAQGDEPNPRRSLVQSFKEATQGHHKTSYDEDSPARRTVAQISEAWQQLSGAKQRHLAEQAEKERERQARAEAQARKKHLEDIASRADAIWKQASAWIAKRTPKGYDRAVELLSDLKDAAAVANRTEEFDEQLRDLRERHAGKPSLIRRLEQAGLEG
jgi:FtsZ-interacting cell division protein YlmF